MKSVKASTCPKPRRPPCKNGFEVRKNPQGSDCCFKIPKKRSVSKKKSTPKNVSISYDKDGTMKIGGRKCDRLTKPVLLDVAKKLGVVGIREKNTKNVICSALDAIEKGTSNVKVNGKLCRTMKKDQLVAMALSKGITIDDKDTNQIQSLNPEEFMHLLSELEDSVIHFLPYILTRSFLIPVSLSFLL